MNLYDYGLVVKLRRLRLGRWESAGTIYNLDITVHQICSPHPANTLFYYYHGRPGPYYLVYMLLDNYVVENIDEFYSTKLLPDLTLRDLFKSKVR